MITAKKMKCRKIQVKGEEDIDTFRKKDMLTEDVQERIAIAKVILVNQKKDICHHFIYPHIKPHINRHINQR